MSDDQLPLVSPANAPATPPEYPPAFLEFMAKDWSAEEAPPLPPIEHRDVLRARRRTLSAKFPGEVLVVPTQKVQVRSSDTHFRFRPGSDFVYLTGNREPDCTLVMLPSDERGHVDVLFIEPSRNKEDSSFFTDRERGALWVGPRLGIEETKGRYGLDECRPRSELASLLTSVEQSGRPCRVLRGLSTEVDGLVPARAGDADLETALSEQRMIKDAVEIAAIRSAIRSTRKGFDDVLRRLPRAKNERELEAVFERRARLSGGDTGYATIAASGTHACILHYSRNDGPVRRGDLFLLDAGVEGPSLYTADITRTFPVSGRFSKAQRLVYRLVEKAQKAAFEEVAPGRPFAAPYRAAMRVLAKGLIELGVLAVELDVALDEQNQLYRRYTLHKLSHMLGLDVHDCPRARKSVYQEGTLKAGMVLTIEPGLYFQPDDLTVPKPFRGIGVRIEDDVLVTADGYENLSAKIPRKLSKVEAWMDRLARKSR